MNSPFSTRNASGTRVIRQANLGLAGNPTSIARAKMQNLQAAGCGQDAGDKVEDSFAAADQLTFATSRIEWGAQSRRVLGPRNARQVFSLPRAIIPTNSSTQRRISRVGGR